MRRPLLRRSALLCAIALALAVSGCDWGTLTRDEFEARETERVCGATFETGGMSPVLQALREASGTPIRATQVVIYPDFATFRLRDRTNVEHLNEWTVRGTEVEPMEPVPVSANEDLDSQTFDLTEYPWDELPRAVQKGGTQLGFESGLTVYLVIERGGVAAALRTTAYFNGPRHSGRVEFDEELEVVALHRNE